LPINSSISIACGTNAYTLVVEPWAEEYTINPGDLCEVVANHPTEICRFQVEPGNGTIVLWVNTGDATYQFWRNGTLEFSTDVPIPGPLNEFDRWRQANRDG
jgi:hypothetical protein